MDNDYRSKHHHGQGLLDVAAMPVFTVNDPASELSPEFGSTNTVPVPVTGTLQGLGNGVQLLQRRPSRYKAIIYIGSLPSTGSVAIQNVAVGATGVATANLNSFPVIVTVSGGTVTAITVNGVTTGATSGSFLLQPGGLIATTNTGAPTYTTTLPTGASAPSTGSASVVFSSRLDSLSNTNNPQGYTVVSAPHIYQWENEQPLYAIAIGAAVNVAVIDQASLARVARLPELQEGYGLKEEYMEVGGGIAVESGAGNDY